MEVLFRKIVCYCILFIGAGFITSCSDEESIDPYDINYVYTYLPQETEFSIAYLKDGTFTKTIDEEKILVPVRCTKPAPTDLTVTFSVDESLIDSYNKKHGTQCVLLKNVKLENTVLTIKKGEYVSAESLKVTYTDMTEFMDGNREYILPVTIAEVKGEGVTVSETKGQFFLTYESNLIMIGLEDASDDDMIFPDDDWAISKDGFFDEDLTRDLTDFMSFTGAACNDDRETIFVVNIGKKQKVSGLVLSFEIPDYSAKSAFVSVSSDGENYTDLGEVNLIKANQSILTIYDPQEVQYIKIAISGSWNSYDNNPPFLGDILVLTPPKE